MACTGTAVLVRKDMRVADQFIVPGSQRATGGTSKSACAVCVQLPRMRLWCVSIHTTWGGNEEAAQKRMYHLRLLHDALTARALPGDAVVVGGDFNCSVEDPQLDAIAACDCLARLQRVHMPGSTYTRSDGRSSRSPPCSSHVTLARHSISGVTTCIDHFFLSESLQPCVPEVQPLIGVGQPCAALHPHVSRRFDQP